MFARPSSTCFPRRGAALAPLALLLAACAPEGATGTAKEDVTTTTSSLDGAVLLPHLGPIAGAPEVRDVVQLDVWSVAPVADLTQVRVHVGATTTEELTRVGAFDAKVARGDGCPATFCLRLGPSEIEAVLSGAPLRIEHRGETAHAPLALSAGIPDGVESAIRDDACRAEWDYYVQQEAVAAQLDPRAFERLAFTPHPDATVSVHVTLEPGFVFSGDRSTEAQLWTDGPSARPASSRPSTFTGADGREPQTLSFLFPRAEFARAVARRASVNVCAPYRPGAPASYDVAATPLLSGRARVLPRPAPP